MSKTNLIKTREDTRASEGLADPDPHRVKESQKIPNANSNS